jgi:hypothetical protein
MDKGFLMQREASLQFSQRAQATINHEQTTQHARKFHQSN